MLAKKTFWFVSFYWEDEENANGFGHTAFSFNSLVLPLGTTIKNLKTEMGVNNIVLLNYHEIKHEQYEEFKKHLTQEQTI